LLVDEKWNFMVGHDLINPEKSVSQSGKDPIFITTLISQSKKLLLTQRRVR